MVGLGRVGALVAQRALAFGMRLVAYDPFVSADRAKHMGVELMGLEELMAESDFVTVHLPKNAETLGLIGKDLLAKAKPGLRIINTARGGIVDEEALAEAIRSGQRPGGRTRRLRQGADHRVAAVRAALGGRGPPPRARRRPRPRTRPGVTIAEQVILALTVTSCPSPSTWRPPTCPRRSARSWAWPSSWAGSCRA